MDSLKSSKGNISHSFLDNKKSPARIINFSLFLSFVCNSNIRMITFAQMQNDVNKEFCANALKLRKLLKALLTKK